MRWFWTIIVLFVLYLVLASCTFVEADMERGTVSVLTIATSRQAVRVTRASDGSVSWSAKESNADASLGEAVLNLSKVAATAAGVP